VDALQRASIAEIRFHKDDLPKAFPCAVVVLEKSSVQIEAVIADRLKVKKEWGCDQMAKLPSLPC
jgi:hypothetical protein